MILVVPLWLLSLLTPFFTMVGQKAKLEIKKEIARDKKKEKELAKKQKALKRLSDDLRKAEEHHLAKVKEEFARAEKSAEVKKEIAAKITAMKVEIEEDPYSMEGDEKGVQE